jgi:hypothetical protein
MFWGVSAAARWARRFERNSSATAEALAEPSALSHDPQRYSGTMRRAGPVILGRALARRSSGRRNDSGRAHMPERAVMERAEKDRREGKSASTQAGEFVREEMDHIRAGKHGARSPQQAIAIGLSKARRAGVKLPAPKKGKTSQETREGAQRDLARGKTGAPRKPSVTRSRAASAALKKEGRAAASPSALSRHAKTAAAKRSPASRSAAAEKAVQTKGAAGRSTAAKKAARTRARKKS